MILSEFKASMNLSYSDKKIYFIQTKDAVIIDGDFYRDLATVFNNL